MYIFLNPKGEEDSSCNIDGFIAMYRISSYTFRGNDFFLDSEIQRSQYIRPKVTVHKCAETIWGNTVLIFQKHVKYVHVKASENI